MAGMKKKKLKFKIINIALAAFALYSMVSFIFMQVDINNQKKELEAINEEIKEQQYLNDEYQGMIDSGLNEDYLIRLAREKLGYVFPDEDVYIDMNKTSK